jgi:hypothetical protein
MDKVKVLGTEITFYQKNDDDYISLTDMAKKFGDDAMIYSWMRNRNTLKFIGIWEELHNPNLNSNEFATFKPVKFDGVPHSQALLGNKHKRAVVGNWPHPPACARWLLLFQGCDLL